MLYNLNQSYSISVLLPKLMLGAALLKIEHIKYTQTRPYLHQC